MHDKNHNMQTCEMTVNIVHELNGLNKMKQFLFHNMKIIKMKYKINRKSYARKNSDKT